MLRTLVLELDSAQSPVHIASILPDQSDATSISHQPIRGQYPTFLLLLPLKQCIILLTQLLNLIS